MHIPTSICLLLLLPRNYYRYWYTCLWQKMYKNMISSRSNSPSAQTWYHSSPLRATPKDGTVSSLPKKNYQATSSFLMWAPNSVWKVMIQEEKKKSRHSQTGCGQLMERVSGIQKSRVVHCLAGHTMEPRLLRYHHTGRKPALNFKLTSSHLWESFVVFAGFTCVRLLSTHTSIL